MTTARPHRMPARQMLTQNGPTGSPPANPVRDAGRESIVPPAQQSTVLATPVCQRDHRPARGSSTILSRDPHQFIRVVQLIGLSLIILTIAVATAVVTDMRRRTEEGYRREVSTLGIALAEQTSRYIQEIDPVLRELQSLIAAAGRDTPARLRDEIGTTEFNALLKGRLRNMAQVNSLIIFDAAGFVVNSSRDYAGPRVNAADRDFFLRLADHDDSDLFVSTPTTSRVDGTSTLFVARRVNASDGHFLGVVAATLDIQYLNAFYQSVSTLPGRSVTLLRADGLILTRYPDPTDQTGEYMPKQSPWYQIVAAGGGQYRSPGFLGQIPALVSVHPLRTYPLVVDVSVKEFIEMEAWRRQAWMLGFAGLAAVAGFILLVWFIAIQFRRQERQNAALRDSADALRESERVAAEKSSLLHATLEHMDQGLMMIAADDRVAICNRRAMELLDLPPELMTMQPKWDDVLKYQWDNHEFSRTDIALRGHVRRSALLDGPAIYDRERPNGTFLEGTNEPLAGWEGRSNLY